MLIACAAGLALGLAPAVQVRNANLAEASNRPPATPPDRRDGRRFRGALVVAEVAFAMLLLVGAGLLIRSVQQLAAIRPGYDPEHVLTLRVGLPRLAAAPGIATPTAPDARTVVMVRDVLSRLAQIPSVEPSPGQRRAAGWRRRQFFTAEGQPPVTAQNRPRAYPHRVSPDFFRTLRIPFLAGRTFTDSEMQGDCERRDRERGRGQTLLARAGPHRQAHQERQPRLEDRRG